MSSAAGVILLKKGARCIEKLSIWKMGKQSASVLSMPKAWQRD